MTKNLLLGIAAVCGSTFQAVACTGISLTSRDGSYVQARTIEWARGVLQSEYVIIPRGQQLTSFTPTAVSYTHLDVYKRQAVHRSPLMRLMG